jgi:hypothetical protein
MSFIWFCIVSYGLTQLLVYAKILERIRPTDGFLGDLLSCPMCTGFWVGIFLWCVSGYTTLFNFDSSLITALLLGFAGSASGYVPNVLFGDEGLKLEKFVHIRKEIVYDIDDKDSLDA